MSNSCVKKNIFLVFDYDYEINLFGHIIKNSKIIKKKIIYFLNRRRIRN